VGMLRFGRVSDQLRVLFSKFKHLNLQLVRLFPEHVEQTVLLGHLLLHQGRAQRLQIQITLGSAHRAFESHDADILQLLLLSLHGFNGG
jgi:hypothetical protein